MLKFLIIFLFFKKVKIRIENKGKKSKIVNIFFIIKVIIVLYINRANSGIRTHNIQNHNLKLYH